MPNPSGSIRHCTCFLVYRTIRRMKTLNSSSKQLSKITVVEKMYHCTSIVWRIGYIPLKSYFYFSDNREKWNVVIKVMGWISKNLPCLCPGSYTKHASEQQSLSKTRLQCLKNISFWTSTSMEKYGGNSTEMCYSWLIVYLSSQSTGSFLRWQLKAESE